MLILLIAGSVAAGWCATVTIFVAVMHAKKLRATTGLTDFWKWPLTATGVIGLVLDVALFNYLIGTLCFRELPRLREPTFSARVQRHYLETPRPRMAQFWADRLREIDPTHIHEART